MKNVNGNGASLTERTISALGWRFSSRISSISIQFVVGVILARLLPVEAFGLIAIAMIVIGFADVISEIGMSPAIIQRKNLSQTHIAVGFTISLIMGLFLAGVVLAIAPIAAVIMRNSEIIPIIRILSITFVLKSATSVSSALLQRKLAFRKLFWVELISYLLGYAVIGVSLAVFDWGVLSLVWANVIQSFIRAVLLFSFSRHALQLSLSIQEAKELLQFGIGTSLARIVNYGGRNGDYFVIGRLLGTQALGIYSRAFQLMTIPIINFSSVISTVLFPAYSEIQNDPMRLQRAFLKSLSIVSVIISPILCAMVIGAPEIIRGIYGPKWIDATLPFQILCFGGISRATYNLVDALARARGAVYQQFWRHLQYAVVVLCASFLGANWGINGVAIGIVISLLIMHIVMAQLANQLLDTSWREFLLAQAPGLILSLILILISLPITLILRAAKVPDLIIIAWNFSSCVIVLGTGILLFPDQWLGGVRSIFTRSVGRFFRSSSSKTLVSNDIN